MPLVAFKWSTVAHVFRKKKQKKKFQASKAGTLVRAVRDVGSHRTDTISLWYHREELGLREDGYSKGGTWTPPRAIVSRTLLVGITKPL